MEVWEFQAETLHFILFQLIPDGVQALSSASVPASRSEASFSCQPTTSGGESGRRVGRHEAAHVFSRLFKRRMKAKEEVKGKREAESRREAEPLQQNVLSQLQRS